MGKRPTYEDSKEMRNVMEQTNKNNTADTRTGLRINWVKLWNYEQQFYLMFRKVMIFLIIFFLVGLTELQ